MLAILKWCERKHLSDWELQAIQDGQPIMAILILEAESALPGWFG